MTFRKNPDWNLITNPGIAKILKRIFLGVVAVGVVLIISLTLLIVYGLTKVNTVLPNQNTLELVGLQRLMSTKEIVLNEQQKNQMLPLIQQISASGQNPDQMQQIKTQVMDILTKEQITSLKSWQSKNSPDTSSLIEIGKKSAANSISNYTGLSTEEGLRIVNSLTNFLPFAKTESLSPEGLTKQLEGSN